MEKYDKIFFCRDDKRIFPGETFAFDFEYSPDADSSQRLFFTGETDNFYFWKSEYCCPTLYKRIDDSLIPGESGAWGLKFTGADFPRVCFKKITCPPVAGYIPLADCGSDWTAGFSVKANGFKLKEGGYLRLTIEVRYKKDGMCPTSANFAPDSEYVINVPEGSYPLQKLSLSLRLDANDIAGVMFIFEGENYEGEAVFEDPVFTNNEREFNLLAPFAPDTAAYAKFFNWYGVNLSHTEWPAVRISINGREVFCGEFFERCHRYSEKEFAIPAGCLKSGKNHIEFTLCSDWHDPLPYRLREVGIVSQPHHAFDLISYPEIAVKNKPFSLLVEVRQPMKLRVAGNVSVHSNIEFDRAGLYGISLCCHETAVNVGVTLSGGGRNESFTVKRVIEREEDGVLTGTGDLIYINQNRDDFENYIKWYCSNRIGEMLTVRPTYRWSGTRKLNGPLWDEFMRILDSMGMKYPHMLDGREPNGYCANPSLKELSKGAGFLGRQLHERDGAYSYWGSYERISDFWNINNFYDVSLFFDQLLRLSRNDPEHAGDVLYDEDIFFDGDRIWLRHDPALPADAKVRAEDVTSSLSRIRYGATRHTGPSILFKYFLMAGYSWIGAETMDSPTEFLMAALRGAAESFGVRSVGVHHALQWSSSPHEDPMRYRRYRLALYICWMLGAHESNTEEGLWHMEEHYEAHHRHSIAAKEHLKVQQDFNRYILSHSRRGTFKTNIALLHGRYDGATCFGRSSPWGARAKDFKTGFDAEESWHIPRRLFYPNADRGWRAVKHNCTGGPIGLVSGNPLGNFNIVPVERPWRHYDVLAFIGYNCAEKEDLDRLLSAVKDGSSLLLTAAHLSCTTRRSDTESYRLDYEEHELFSLLGFESTPVFKDDTLGDKPLKIGAVLPNENSKVLLQSDSGRPLVFEVAVGPGRIVFFNTPLYPAADVIKDLYSDQLRRLSEDSLKKEFVLPLVDNTVQADCYQLSDGSMEVYFIAVDWWNDPDAPRNAGIKIGEYVYNITLPFGVMKKVKISGRTAIICERESGDALSLSDDEVLLQGEGKEPFTLLRDGKLMPFAADFSSAPQKRVRLSDIAASDIS